MLFTMAISLVGLGLTIGQVMYGAGRHRGDVDPAIYEYGMKLNFIGQPTYLYAICFVKLAVGSSLLRIASTKAYRWTIMGIMGFMLFYTVGCFFTIIFQCTDIRVIWDPTISSVCWGQKTLQGLSYTNVALNIITDLLFAIVIPAPMLWKLNVHRRTRISLIAILGLGVFACAAAVIKIGYIANYGKVGDFLWDSQDITIWTATETNIGIIAGSLPALRPLFKTFLGSTYGRGTRPTPSGPSAYAHGTKSGDKSNWQSLSSGRRRAKDEFGDDASSQEAIAGVIRPNEYEMRGGIAKPHGSTVVTATVSGDSDEEMERNGARSRQRGITKTMVTTVDYSNS
jgi:hypothetical protein